MSVAPGMNLQHRAEARFWSKVDRSGGPDSCWLWIAPARDGRGEYGSFWDGTKMVGAHCFAYSIVHGPAPAGYDVHHKCENTLCCNPSHLSAIPKPDHLRLPGHPADRNAQKTHCPHGHEYTPENTYRLKRGVRQCAECGRIRDRQRYRSEGKYRQSKLSRR